MLREAVSEARILLESHKKAMEETIRATEESAKRKALDEFLADVRTVPDFLRPAVAAPAGSTGRGASPRRDHDEQPFRAS